MEILYLTRKAINTNLNTFHDLSWEVSPVVILLQMIGAGDNDSNNQPQIVDLLTTTFSEPRRPLFRVLH